MVPDQGLAADRPSRRSRLVNRNWTNAILDKWLFFIFFAIGGTSIIVLKAVGVSQGVVTIVPVCVLVAYAAMVFSHPRLRLRYDQAADCAYYLGFLFTLISLAYALYEFQNSERPVESIITNFGIALATTIVGLVLRVVFSQLRQDPVEYEREARLSLAEAAERLRAQLDSMLADLTTFRIGLAQSMQEGIQAVVDKANVSMTSNAEKFGEVGDHMVDSLTATFSAFSDHSTKLNQAAAQTVDAMEQMFRRLQQVEAAPDMISSKLAPMIDVVKKVLTAAEKRSAAHEETFAQLAQRATIFAASAEALQAAVEASRTAWSGQADQLARILPAAEADAAKLRATVSEILSGFASDVAPIRRVVEQLAKVVQEDAAIIAQHRVELQQNLQASRSAVLDTQRSLTSMAELVVEKLDGR